MDGIESASASEGIVDTPPPEAANPPPEPSVGPPPPPTAELEQGEAKCVEMLADMLDRIEQDEAKCVEKLILLGFIAVSPTAGARATDFPGRMVAYPIMPGFDEREPLGELRKRTRAEGSDYTGYAVVLRGDDVALMPVPE